MEKFVKERETKGREKWFNLIKKDVQRGKKMIEFTPFKDGIDFYMTATTGNNYIITSTTENNYVEILGEIKDVHRSYYYKNYKTFQIDYWKLKKMQEEAALTGKRAYLVVFLTDYTIVWDITDINLEERKYIRLCTKTTGDYQEKVENKVPKEEVWLVKEEALWCKSTTL